MCGCRRRVRADLIRDPGVTARARRAGRGRRRSASLAEVLGSRDHVVFDNREDEEQFLNGSTVSSRRVAPYERDAPVPCGVEGDCHDPSVPCDADHGRDIAEEIVVTVEQPEPRHPVVDEVDIGRMQSAQSLPVAPVGRRDDRHVRSDDRLERRSFPGEVPGIELGHHGVALVYVEDDGLGDEVIVVELHDRETLDLPNEARGGLAADHLVVKTSVPRARVCAGRTGRCS